MPRKGKYAADLDYDDYDDDYDGYYDDDDDDEDDRGHDSKWSSHGQNEIAQSSRVEESQEATTLHFKDQQISSHVGEMPGSQSSKVWKCSVCTFDNPEGLQSCDICGVLRHLPVSELAPDSESSAKVSTSADRSLSSMTKEVTMPSTVKSGTKQQVIQRHAEDILKNDQNGIVPTSVHNNKAQLTKGLKSMNLNMDSKDQGRLIRGKGLPLDSYHPEEWMLDGFEQESKQLLHLAIIGHVDAGKSTLMGRLLHILGRVSQKEMHKYEKEAKQKGKGSFSYAWVLDESAEERARGVTMTVAVAHFETPKFRVILLDSPGHKDFVPNMISGASQADAAILVVDASTGAFEAGMEGEGQSGGQTREHTQLIRSFGVDQITIVVNKMDAVEYSHDRFIAIKASLRPFLRHCGFKDSGIKWVPLSAMENQNLVTVPSEVRLKTWCPGPSLLEVIDTFEAPSRNILKPFRMPIAETVKSRTLGQAAISGKLEGGAIKIGSKVLVIPAGILATVKGIEQAGKPCTSARAGDNADVGLQGVEPLYLVQGGVLCHPDYPVTPASRLEVKVLILETSSPLLCGSQVVFYCHHIKEPAKITRLVSLLDQKSGAVLKKQPRCLLPNQSAIIEVVPERGVCVEEYSSYRGLGRVTLRDGGKTLAVGIVTRVVDYE